MTIEKMYTVEEIANILSLNQMTIWRAIKAKKLKAYKIGKQYRIKEKDYNKYIQG